MDLGYDMANVDYGYVNGIAYTIVDTVSHVCAFVGLPDTHPFSSMTGEMIPLEVHGGITFKSYNVKRFPYPNLMWIGWDYAHFGDYTGYMSKLDIVGSDDIKHTFEMVHVDVMDTIKQIIKFDKESNNLIRKQIMDKINTGVEQRAAKRTLEIMKENVMKFRLDEVLKEKIASLSKQKAPFTDEQCSYIDGLYERYMKLGGFPSVGVKHDYVKKY